MNTTTVTGPVKVALSKRVLDPLERIATALEALVQQGQPNVVNISTSQSSAAIQEGVNTALDRLSLNLGLEPSDERPRVYNAEAARALPVGTKLLWAQAQSTCGYSEIVAPGRWMYDNGARWAGEKPKDVVQLAWTEEGQIVLNPEILGESKLIEVVPTYLEGQEAYDAAPVGTEVADGIDRLIKVDAEGGWTATASWAVSSRFTQLNARRKVLRWGPAPLAVGDIVEVTESLPVGIELGIKGNGGGIAGQIGFLKAADGWYAMSTGRLATTPPAVGNRRRILALP